jgi:hypothetical protein
MTKWVDKFKIFSLTEKRVEDVLNTCGSLILKAQELNFVVEQNMKEIKLFFKWLHTSIVHLTDDQAVTEMLNEEMENSILNFINNTFKDDQTINLEKVGQYLKGDNLRILLNEDNEWQEFVCHNLEPKGDLLDTGRVSLGLIEVILLLCLFIKTSSIYTKSNGKSR